MSLHKYLNTQTQKVLLYRHLLAKISRIQKNLKTEQSGFTLIELLVAMVILTIVVGMTGTGLVFVMSKNTSSDGEITQQTNLRRALDFIGDEIKSASVVTTSSTDSKWPAWALTLSPTLSSSTPSTALYLEIPTPVSLEPADITALLASPSTIKIPNHGLANTNAVKISGNNLPSDTTQTINTTSTYYVSSVSATTPNTFQLITGSGSTVSFTSTPQNFAIRRLVLYYPGYIANSGWKGEQVLYRATGVCNSTSTTANPSNCLVMVDSLVAQPTTPSASTAPFFPSIVAGLPPTISLNGKLCNPPTPENNCATTENNKVSVSLTAISRATLQ